MREKHGWVRSVCTSLQVSKSPPQLQFIFFPISFFNCKYSTSHYYDAFPWVVISHFGNFIFIFVVLGEYSFDEYVCVCVCVCVFFPTGKTRINIF
jgi:hypothetical protein